MIDFENAELFKGKSFADVFKEIHENNREIDEKINDIVDEMKVMVKTPSDVAVLGPVVKDYLDTKIKNNDILVKLMKVVEGMITKNSKNEDEDEDDMSEDEMAEYLEIQRNSKINN